MGYKNFAATNLPGSLELPGRWLSPSLNFYLSTLASLGKFFARQFGSELTDENPCIIKLDI
jgi:hypothetical protein